LTVLQEVRYMKHYCHFPARLFIHNIKSDTIQNSYKNPQTHDRTSSA
jgi:hypothetical protein